MKNVLIIAYYFPPSTGVGGLRPYGIAKYLPNFGWNPIVLTPHLPGETELKCQIIQTDYDDVVENCKKKLGLDSKRSLNDQFNASCAKNNRSFYDKIAFIPGEIITYPDGCKGWYPHAIRSGDEIISSNRIDAILSTSPPTTSHLIAKSLSERHQLPWLADFRDLWTQNPYFYHCTLRRFFEKRLELRTLRKASALVTVSKPLADDLSRLHTDKPVNYITNGFDPEDACFDPPELTDKFTITYTGTLYSGKRDPSMLFKALKNLIDDGVIDPKLLEARFFGPQESWLFDEIKTNNLDNVVRVFGFVPRYQSLIRQRESHLLLLLLWNNPKNKGVYTGKVFEYLAAGRPIIALGGPEGSVVQDLLTETEAGHYISSQRELEILLSNYYSEYIRTGTIPYTNESAIMKYSHLEMAKRFADLLDKIKEEAEELQPS